MRLIWRLYGEIVGMIWGLYRIMRGYYGDCTVRMWVLGGD